MAVTVYLIVAAMEDRKSCEVTRIKHLLGFVPAEIVFLMYVGEHTVFDMGMIAMFVALCLFCGKTGIYGLADGFVLTNLSLLFGGISGAAGIGLVILIMILASFSGMAEMLIRGQVSLKNLKLNKKIAFIPSYWLDMVSRHVKVPGWLLYFCKILNSSEGE